MVVEEGGCSCEDDGGGEDGRRCEQNGGAEKNTQ